MTLGRQIVDFVRLNFLDNTDQICGIGKITVVQFESHILLMGILIEMINPIGIKRRSTPFQTMYLIPLFKQKLCQIRSILTGNPGNKCCFHLIFSHGLIFSHLTQADSFTAKTFRHPPCTKITQRTQHSRLSLSLTASHKRSNRQARQLQSFHSFHHN